MGWTRVVAGRKWSWSVQNEWDDTMRMLQSLCSSSKIMKGSCWLWSFFRASQHFCQNKLLLKASVSHPNKVSTRQQNPSFTFPLELNAHSPTHSDSSNRPPRANQPLHYHHYNILWKELFARGSKDATVEGYKEIPFSYECHIIPKGRGRRWMIDVLILLKSFGFLLHTIISGNAEEKHIFSFFKTLLITLMMMFLIILYIQQQ